jgi:hypothetical protein
MVFFPHCHDGRWNHGDTVLAPTLCLRKIRILFGVLPKSSLDCFRLPHPVMDNFVTSQNCNVFGNILELDRGMLSLEYDICTAC